jgi:mandelamide amidase
MARSVVDCALLDGVVTGAPADIAPVTLKGLRIGVPRRGFWENLDPELGEICERVLTRLKEAGVALVDVDMSEELTLDAEAGFPIALYETVHDLGRYLAELKYDLDFAGLAQRAASPDVNGLLNSLAGAGAVPEPVYKKAMEQRAAMQDAYRRHFSENAIAAVIFPTTPAPAALIGEDETFLHNGTPHPTFATFIRNSGPGSVAGIPGVSLPAGLTTAGLPVGIEISGPVSTDRQLLAIAAAIEALLPQLPAPSSRN